MKTRLDLHYPYSSDNISINGFENDGTVLDFYSENPNGIDPYNYNHGQRQCGNYSDEDCYNRETHPPICVQ